MILHTEYRHIAPALNPAECRKSIDAVESALMDMPQVELPLKHVFGDGLYGRQIMIPAGVALVGRVHRKDDLNFVMYGEMDVLTESGMKRVTGPCWFAGKAGVKQAGIAYTDTLWVTVHATTNRDLDTVEDEILYPADNCKFDFKTGELKPDEASREDYARALAEYGFTEADVQAQMAAAPYVLASVDGVMLGNSPIHGRGLFATKVFRAGERIGTARARDCKTMLGRFANHSASPNAELVPNGEGLDLVATTLISGGEITTDYRQALRLAGLSPLEAL